MMNLLRTPDSCFENLPGYNFEPHYTTIKDDDGTEIRIHSIDEGPRDADPILLMHGNPSWSYIWRHMMYQNASSQNKNTINNRVRHRYFTHQQCKFCAVHAITVPFAKAAMHIR